MKTHTALSALVCLGLASCGDNNAGNEGAIQDETSTSDSTVETYGKLSDGREAKIFTIKNSNGMVAKITEYGAILVSLEVPDKDGNAKDVTHGYDTLDGWLTNTSYFGATVGRYGNRIAGGKFTLDGEEYALVTNNDPGGVPCHLHGGTVGFDKVLWTGKEIPGGVELTYTSKDGEEGYPGNLQCTVTYTLNDDNELTWKATATTDKATPINVVQHAYWNLSGDPTTSINDHVLMLAADHFLPTDPGLIPTGRFEPVAGTPMDFTSPTAIGERVDEPVIPLQLAGGYDHCWVLRDNPDGGVRLAAKLTDPKSGRSMEVHTDQPGIQFYGGNFLDGTVAGKGGVKYQKRTALCLETELFPDSPNKEDVEAFPTSILRPGETYTHTMVNKFSW